MKATAKPRISNPAGNQRCKAPRTVFATAALVAVLGRIGQNVGTGDQRRDRAADGVECLRQMSGAPVRCASGPRIAT